MPKPTRPTLDGIDRLHLDACERGETYYLDPSTGYRVFTALALERAGRCCGCGCRHCPYGHERVTPSTRRQLKEDPWVSESASVAERSAPCDVLSWSGGKDSFLALLRLKAEALREVVLLTTYDGKSGQVAHQDLPVHVVREQARALGLDIILVPLFTGTQYLDRIEMGLQLLMRRREVARMVFGDLHLRHVRAWREDQVGPRVSPRNIKLHFPLWDVPYEVLSSELFGSDADCHISAVTAPECEGLIAVGDAYTPELISRLPTSVDPFGERGEFHTVMRFGV